MGKFGQNLMKSLVLLPLLLLDVIQAGPITITINDYVDDISTENGAGEVPTKKYATNVGTPVVRTLTFEHDTTILDFRKSTGWVDSATSTDVSYSKTTLETDKVLCDSLKFGGVPLDDTATFQGTRIHDGAVINRVVKIQTVCAWMRDGWAM